VVNEALVIGGRQRRGAVRSEFFELVIVNFHSSYFPPTRAKESVLRSGRLDGGVVPQKALQEVGGVRGGGGGVGSNGTENGAKAFSFVDTWSDAYGQPGVLTLPGLRAGVPASFVSQRQVSRATQSATTPHWRPNGR
jgi:hypothetical protein